MGRLIESSVPGMVEYDQACWRLAERAVLATAVCRELAAAGPDFNARAAEAAVGLLMRWLDQQGLKLLSLEGMVVPELRPVFSGDPVLDPEPGAITEQILVAEAVCDQFLFMQTADTTMELESDRRGLRAKLDAWLALGH